MKKAAAVTEHRSDRNPTPDGTPDRLAIAASRPDDRAAIGEIVRRSGVFSAEEEETVYELFDEYVESDDSGYEWLSARVDGALAGFICFGSTPLTEGGYDLYWICTDPDWRNRGIGRCLFAAMESSIRKWGGRLVMIWTSGAEAYLPSHRFYERMGCGLSATVRDYYRPGEDLLVFVKYLPPRKTKKKTS
ncbi:MAG: GNAT family N-acetyltransferase [Anaerolineales bacterium]